MGIVASSWEHFIITRRERFVRRAFLSLVMAVIAAVAAMIFVGAAAVAEFAVCGDNSYCDPHPWSLNHVEGVFLLLATGATVVTAVFLIRTAVLFGFATRRQTVQASDPPLVD